MTNDIITNLGVIEQSVNWADTYKKESFPREVLKSYRRRLKKIYDALSENCSAAAYGESQVGKSYLMSSLLSTPETPFVIENNGEKYSFIDKINPSGGNNTKKESTGVITRFTIRQSNPRMSDYVRITNLSMVDIILLLADAYYNDVVIDPDSVMLVDKVNLALTQPEMTNLWASRNSIQTVITEDDIKDIEEYLQRIIGHSAVNISKSNFSKVIAPVIDKVAPENWVNIFGLIWNNNSHFNVLFSTLVEKYKMLDFQTNVYVPFDAVLRDKGTLLKIDWLDSVCGKPAEIQSGEEEYTDVYDESGNLIVQKFSKAYLSALIGELTFVLPKEISKDRNFLEKIDLLDFPGARSREHIKEGKLGEALPTILRRGKVAYLFNKYSRSLKISSVLFCHHNDQKTESTIGTSIHNWLEDNIGKTPEQRAQYLMKTERVAPLFLVCTKFNIDLEQTKNDSPDNKEKLNEHWTRFDTTLPKIIVADRWMEDWVPRGGAFTSSYFQNVYLLRDFYWSSKNQVFDGYDEDRGTPETDVHVSDKYPNYFEDLRNSFLANTFVKKHFANPVQAWNDVATVNNDGSKAIIRNLNKIANVLDVARREKYLHELRGLRDELINRLSSYYESADMEQKNVRIRQITGDIKLQTEFAFGDNPEIFGRIIDALMVPSSEFRSIAYDILVRHIEEPKTMSAIRMIRASAGIDINDDRAANIIKLTGRYNKTEAELQRYFHSQGISLEDVVSDDTELLATVPDVITKYILQHWNNHINDQVKLMGDLLPHADEIAFMILSLVDKLGVKKRIATRISKYYNLFDKTILPNAIADYAALTLNNFVSTVGREYMTEDDIMNVKRKAESCHLQIDLSASISSSNVEQRPILEVLTALDQSYSEMNSSRIDIGTLRKLPFWDSYQRWENFITIGLLYASDVSHVNPVANDAMRRIIETCKQLYQ